MAVTPGGCDHTKLAGRVCPSCKNRVCVDCLAGCTTSGYCVMCGKYNDPPRKPRPLTSLMLEVLRALQRFEKADPDTRWKGRTAGQIAREIIRNGDPEVGALLDTPIRQHGSGAKDGRSWSGHMHEAQRLHGPLAGLRKRKLISSGYERGRATRNHLTREGRAVLDGH